jgi:hypothetical protein
MNDPFISFVREPVLDDDFDCVEDQGERLSLRVRGDELLLEVENDGTDDDGNPYTRDGWFLFSKEEIRTLRDFLNRHFGE